MKYYLDCEFNGFEGELISMALVSDGSREIYLANKEFERAAHWAKKQPEIKTPGIDPWVWANVLPIIETPYAAPLWCPLNQFAAHLSTLFLGDRAPIVATDWPDDIKYLCQCLITGPGEMINIPGITFEMHRVDAYPTTMPEAVQHNAYSDAMALRHKLTGAA